MKKILIFIVMLLPFISEAQNDSGSLYMTAREFGLRQKRLVLSRVFLTPSLATPYDSANANIYYDTDIQAFLFRENGVWVRYGSTTYPAGNYGNVQLNRNGLFATPASDSFSVNGGVLTFKGAVQLGGSGYALGDFGQGHIYNTTVYGTVWRPKAGSSLLYVIKNNLDEDVIWTAASDMGVFFGQNIYMSSGGAAKLFFKSNESTDYMQQSAAGIIKTYLGGNIVTEAKTTGLEVTGSLSATEKFTLSGDISPSQITANQNNYAPTGITTASVLRLNSDAARSITGLTGGVDGRFIYIYNTGSFAITLEDEDGNSTAANRFEFSSDKSIAGAEGIGLWYDATSLRWRSFESVYTADNGLTVTGRNIQLGGTLLHATTIATDAYLLTISTSTAGIQPLYVSAGTGKGFSVTNNSSSNSAASISNGSTGNGLEVQSSGGIGVVVSTSGSGDGIQGSAIDGVAAHLFVNPTSTNTVVPVISVRRNTQGTAGDGIGGSIDIMPESGGLATLANQIISKWSTVNFATRTSRLIFTGVNSTTTADLLTIEGNGSTKLNKYGVGTFGATPTYGLGVDGSGNLVETSANVEGSYTPTHFLTTNIAATTSLTTYYIRVGDWVHVWGECDIDPTTPLIISELGISLPIATSITNTYELSGTGSYEDNTSVKIAGDVTNDRAKFRFIPQTSTNNRYSFHFSYKWVAP